MPRPRQSLEPSPLRPPRRALTSLLALAALGGACGEASDHATVSTGGRPAPDQDAGSTGPPLRPVRLDAGPRLPGADDELELPYAGGPVTHRIEIEADLSALDVHLSIDTTLSIAAEIDQLQKDLRQRIVPQLGERVEDVSFGVSHFEDFPGGDFGFAGNDKVRGPDTPFELLTPVTSDLEAVTSAVARLDVPLGVGGDIPESGAEALWQIATGAGYELEGEQLVAPFDGRARPGGGSIGGVGFRSGALHVVVHVTDAPSHRPRDYGALFPGTHSLEEASEALSEIGVRVVGVVSNNCEKDSACEVGLLFGLAARDDLERVALATGAVAQGEADECPHGIDGEPVPANQGQCPLVFDVDGDGNGLADTVVDAIVALVDGIRFSRVHGEAANDPLGFVTRVTPVELKQSDGADPPRIEDLLPEDEPDGTPDSFVDVHSRARLGFDVELQNDLIAPTDREQSFRVVIRVLGDGLTVLERTLRVSVPAGIPAGDGQGPDGDAGATAAP